LFNPFQFTCFVLNPFETILLSFNFSTHLKKSFVLNPLNLFTFLYISNPFELTLLCFESF